MRNHVVPLYLHCIHIKQTHPKPSDLNLSPVKAIHTEKWYRRRNNPSEMTNQDHTFKTERMW